jgi:hypothetical protein
MNKRVKYALIAVAAIPLAAGMVGALADEARGKPEGSASTSVRVTQTPSETPRATPKPDPKPAQDVTPTARSSSEDGEAALTQVAMEITWGRVSDEDKTQLCVAWRADEYTSLEAFMEGAASTNAHLDSPTVIKFLDQKCGPGGKVGDES